MGFRLLTLCQPTSTCDTTASSASTGADDTSPATDKIPYATTATTDMVTTVENFMLLSPD